MAAAASIRLTGPSPRWSESEVKVDIAQDCRSLSGEVIVFNPDTDVDVES